MLSVSLGKPDRLFRESYLNEVWETGSGHFLAFQNKNKKYLSHIVSLNLSLMASYTLKNKTSKSTKA